jgi:hypothetical protein
VPEAVIEAATPEIVDAQVTEMIEEPETTAPTKAKRATKAKKAAPKRKTAVKKKS